MTKGQEVNPDGLKTAFPNDVEQAQFKPGRRGIFSHRIPAKYVHAST
jgi:hypothetical protein